MGWGAEAEGVGVDLVAEFRGEVEEWGTGGVSGGGGGGGLVRLIEWEC